ncbi:response regulator [Aeromonas allosaccharophila]|uniref:response regulator n=1 Tax=Aeromonas allosaccharophila TaxID=656 RepID=UPI0034402950
MSQQQYKVLVVDDDLKLRSLLERYLTEQGFVVRGVANGEQADRLLTRENFSLMVLDLMLPGEDGLSICRRLREAGNQIPVLMLTAKGDEVDRIVGLEMGADDYLPKPFNPREPMALTSGEFAVLKVLVSHPREPLSRDKLMNLARGREYTATERSIDVQVSRLRRLLEQDPAQPRYLQTVWGLGYVFVPDGDGA